MAFEKKEIDRREMLMILGKIYAITATGKGRIGLVRYIRKEGGPTLVGKYTIIARAMLRMGLLQNVEGKGKTTIYRWNLKKYGPPSLALAEKMIYETEEQARISARKRYQARLGRIKREENC